MAFRSVGALHPHKSGFNLDYNKIFDCDLGYLIPVMCDEVVPGDVFKIGAEALVRMMPAVAPIMQQITMKTHYFFVPYRLLWSDWENFITGGRDGDFESLMPYIKGQITDHSLGDYFGFPLTNYTGNEQLKVSAFPFLAYNFVWNEYYRDENFQAYEKYHVDTYFDEASLIEDDKFLSRYGKLSKLECDLSKFEIKKKNWQKDYFTSSLFARQRGPAVALPISGILPVTSSSPNVFPVVGLNGPTTFPTVNLSLSSTGTDRKLDTNITNGTYPTSAGLSWNPGITIPQGTPLGSVNLSQAVTFDISDLRLATQIQKWQERNMRAGIRYTEFLKAHFGVSPSDSRLDRPEYIGKFSAPIIVSEVLQSSSSDSTSPQGNMAGHGIAVGCKYVGKYHALEYGLIIGIMSITPKPTYNSQGINRQWLRQTNKDFYFPEFANLSEQAVYNGELNWLIPDGDRDGVFGYQGAYDEMRTKQDLVCGLMRVDPDGQDLGLSYWHLARSFPVGQPVRLNSSFIECNPRKTFLAVPSEPAFIVHYGNSIKAWRPMPEIAEPGLMDHH